jgi:hypothetical protein
MHIFHTKLLQKNTYDYNDNFSTFYIFYVLLKHLTILTNLNIFAYLSNYQKTLLFNAKSAILAKKHAG